MKPGVFEAIFGRYFLAVFGKEMMNSPTPREVYQTLCVVVLGLVRREWHEKTHKLLTGTGKIAGYLSMEYLFGPSLEKNLICLGAREDVRSLTRLMGLSFEEILSLDVDPALGNGGLGRLAADYFDSIAELDLPVVGYGIYYEYGLFEQHIVDGHQVERPDHWRRHHSPWTEESGGRSFSVSFGGGVRHSCGENGRDIAVYEPEETVRAVPFLFPILGDHGKTVATVKLWQANASDYFDLDLYNEGQFVRASEREVKLSNISCVLYPSDAGQEGKKLRLEQEYFLSSASLQDLLNILESRKNFKIEDLAENLSVQLNDTHPVLSILELLRILLDNRGLEWNEAWSIVSKVFNYTNHTVMKEALEAWDVNLFRRVLPRIYELVDRVNHQLIDELRQNGRKEDEAEVSIIGQGTIHMDRLAFYSCAAVNGVAALHTEILKHSIFKGFHNLYPQKLRNVTNGISPRVWLETANPALTFLINETIGDAWQSDLSALEQLKEHIDDRDLQVALGKIKMESKRRAARYLSRYSLGREIHPTSIFDMQLKRIHEYKRQLMDALHVLSLYFAIKRGETPFKNSRTFVFSGKAASSYVVAKMIISLICDISALVNGDPETKGRLSVVFVPNYSVSSALWLIPAADVSEQISLAGTEASGTGNMKYMLNGALTIGTLDGANVEIFNRAGAENVFQFGLTEEEVLEEKKSYNPMQQLEQNPALDEAVKALANSSSLFESGHNYAQLYDSLTRGVFGNAPDQYMVLRDFSSYALAHKAIDKAYSDQTTWGIKSLMNIASSGYFSSDRAVKEYNEKIWHLRELG